MDRVQEAADVVIGINEFKDGKIQAYELIKAVCSYFDRIKDEKISAADLKFLRYISNTIGIPHFYDLLAKFNHNVRIDDLDLNTFSSLIHESTLHTNENSKVHRYQKEILSKFEKDRVNRFFLSASTSFGKTHIVYEIVKRMKYNNVILMFPTIALLSENLERIMSSEDYSEFKNYKVHTLSDIVEFGDKNLFIYTPERYLSFIEKFEDKIRFDFTFVDEVYKIDNDYIIDEEVKENERDVAYRIAVHYSLKNNVDVLLAGPYIDFLPADDEKYNQSFNDFLRINQIELLNYNDYEIVNKYIKDIAPDKDVVFDENLSFRFDSKNKSKRFIEICDRITGLDENLIAYCSNRTNRDGVDFYANKLLASSLYGNHDYTAYSDFIKHIEKYFTKDWIVVKALKKGIGIHHGLVPKYIQKEIISLFNTKELLLKILVSTTTITEGVNTSAKNLIVLANTKGGKPLKKFDAKNIAGRAGRFLHHYSGRVLILDNGFLKDLNSEAEGIKHKNYDPSSVKDEIDLFYTSNDYLSQSDIRAKVKVQEEQAARNIPDSVFNQYKVVSRLDKITVYDNIVRLTREELKQIDKLVYAIQAFNSISFEGLQIVLNCVEPIVKNKNLLGLISRKKLNVKKNKEFSVLIPFTYSYLTGGFIGMMKYKSKEQKKPIDNAIKETAEFVYSTLKYQVVKYLGVFNIMYKFYLSRTQNMNVDEVVALDKLLMRLEYNALTPEGRIASDYGVPANVVRYYEDAENSTSIRANFDSYEAGIFNKIDRIINNS